MVTVRLTKWQWLVLILPIASIVIFLLVAASWQIHAWGLTWIWAIFTLIFVGWRWLLVRWTKPAVNQLETVLTEIQQELESETSVAVDANSGRDRVAQLEANLKTILDTAQQDKAIWEDWPTFWKRCQEVVIAVAQHYHPEVKYPLLNIYIPQAYGLIRGTVDDLDQWMQRLSPTLNQITIGQAYQSYEIYQRLEPSLRKLWKVWGWAQWLLNPAAAAANQASKRSSSAANQQLLLNLTQLLREAALRNLARQAIALYSGNTLPPDIFSNPTATLAKAQTQTLKELLLQAESPEAVQTKPINILLVGRTGAGKSSLINTLFQADKAEIDLLPSTTLVQQYEWKTGQGETLILWDTPGYEQIERTDLREQVLDYASTADLLLLLNPALDPALQMDADFLRDISQQVADLPTFTLISQVDRLRPFREWNPPYDWQWGEKPKEKSIREAVQYRVEQLGDYCSQVLPVVMGDPTVNRIAWGIDALAFALLDAIAPAQQLRLARFFKNLEARTIAAAKLIDRYIFQMSTAQGLTALLKSPVLQFISTLSTGSPTLAYLLAEQIPVEQLPIVIGKLQLAYDLFGLLNENSNQPLNFDLLALWPLLIENDATPDRNAWAFGHALVEYWTQALTPTQLENRFNFYLQSAGNKN
ncbi:MAG: GTPase [Snowella sp.]|nr:GTPase [Snowella sp.]